MRKFEAVSKYKEQNIKLPERSTSGSAGYDFYSPCRQVVPPNISTLDKKFISIPYLLKTGIKVKMEEDEVLQVYLRSSAPEKLHFIMANSVGIIDSDYYNNETNEGEIGFLVYNLSEKRVIIEKGEKLGQGVFTKFLKTDDDNVTEMRFGGFGSTGR